MFMQMNTVHSMLMQTFREVRGEPRVLSGGTPKNRADIGGCPWTYLYNATLGNAGGSGRAHQC